MKELVINLSEDSYKAICSEWMLPSDVENVINAIKNGTELPKGHGELKDANKIEEALDLVNPDNKLAEALKNIIETVPTLIEADKGDTE